jgi:hypothetical protein
VRCEQGGEEGERRLGEGLGGRGGGRRRQQCPVEYDEASRLVEIELPRRALLDASRIESLGQALAGEVVPEERLRQADRLIRRELRLERASDVADGEAPESVRGTVLFV